MKRVSLFLMLFVALWACVDPLPVVFTETDSKLVVDGMITQEQGPYTVKLFYSLIPDQNTQEIRYESQAQVWIMDDTGVSEKLTEFAPGTYRTSPSGIQGQIGRSYSIRIITMRGKEYVSAPQLMKGPGTLDNLYTEFEEDAINGDDPKLPQDVFNLYLDAKGTPESNLFRWRWSGVYEARSFPELKDTLYPRARNPSPAPAKCSGYIYVGGRGLVQVAECTCCICWATEYSTAAVVSDNRFVTDNAFRKVNLGKVEVTSMHFYNRYYAAVEQLSLSEEAYAFWDLVQAQQTATGSIFQPNAIRVRGNIKSSDNPDEIILGFFGVSAVYRMGIFIERDDVPYEVSPIGTIGEDCRKSFANATTVKPFFW